VYAGFPVGTAWADIPAATGLVSVTPAAIDPASVVVELSLRNTHATQTLYLLLEAGATTPVTDAIRVGPGETLDMDGMMRAAAGRPITTLSLQGSAPGTTGVLIVGLQAGST